MLRPQLIVPAALAFFLVTATANADVITNGGFESGNFSGWTQGGNPVFTFVGNTTVHSGNFSATLGSQIVPGSISQTFATTTGLKYELDYYLQNNSKSLSRFAAQINGVDVPGSVLNNASGFGYKKYSFTFIASGPETTLSFTFRDFFSAFHLDDVNATPLPEPGSIAVFGLILGGTVYSWRRRRAAKTV